MRLDDVERKWQRDGMSEAPINSPIAKTTQISVTLSCAGAPHNRRRATAYTGSSRRRGPT